MKAKLIAMTAISILSLNAYAYADYFTRGLGNHDLLRSNQKVAEARNSLNEIWKSRFEKNINECLNASRSMGVCELMIGQQILGYAPPTEESKRLERVIEDCVQDTIKRAKLSKIRLLDESGKEQKGEDLELAAHRLCLKNNHKTVEKLNNISASKEQQYINNVYAMNFFVMSCDKGNKDGCSSRDKTFDRIQQLESELLKN